MVHEAFTAEGTGGGDGGDDFAGDTASSDDFPDIEDVRTSDPSDDDGGGGTTGGTFGDGSAGDDGDDGGDVSGGGSTRRRSFPGPETPDSVSATEQPPDPTGEETPGGVNVTGGEARRLTESALASGSSIRNLGDRQALASQLERLTGVDARELASRTDVDDVSFDPAERQFFVERERDRPRRTRINPAAEDIPGSAEAAQDFVAAGGVVPAAGARPGPRSAEAAQDAFASGALTPVDPAVGQSDAAEAAADLVASGTVEDEFEGPSRGEVMSGVLQFSQQQLQQQPREFSQDLTVEAAGVDFEAMAAGFGVIEEGAAEAGEDFVRGGATGVEQEVGGFFENLGQLGEGLAGTVSEAPRRPPEESAVAFGAGVFESPVRGDPGEFITEAEADEDALQAVTGGGFFSPRDEATLREASAEFQEGADVFAETGVGMIPGVRAERTAASSVGGVDVPIPGSGGMSATVVDDEGPVERVSEGFTSSLIETADPFGAALGIETGAEIAGNLPRELEAGQGEELAESGTALGRGAAVGAGRSFASDPFATGGRFGGGAVASVVGGVAAGRAITRAPSLFRSARIRAQGGEVFDADPDLADPPTRTEGSGLPGFTERAQADPEVAREEFLEQARGTEIAGDEPVAFHVRASEDVAEFGGFGRQFEAPEGGSELRGMFQSADISNLRLPASAGEGTSVPRPGIPFPRIRGARVLAEEDVDVDITEGATRGEINEFLTGDADPMQSFIRTDSGGGPTPEQEVIAPPGAEFATSGGLFGVRVGGINLFGRRIGGEVVTGRLTRRVEPDDFDVDEPTVTGVEMARETRESLSSAVERQASPREPFAPPTLPGATGAGERPALDTDRRDGRDRRQPGRERRDGAVQRRSTRTGARSRSDERDSTPSVASVSESLFGVSTAASVGSEASGASPTSSPFGPASSSGFGEPPSGATPTSIPGVPSEPGPPSSPFPPTTPSESVPDQPPTPGTPTPIIPGIPGVPTGTGRRRDGEPTTDEDEFDGGRAPAGQFFANPILSARESLERAARNFGGFFGGGQ